MAHWVVELQDGEQVRGSEAGSKREAVEKFLELSGLKDGRSWKWWIKKGSIKVRKVSGGDAHDSS